MRICVDGKDCSATSFEEPQAFGFYQVRCLATEAFEVQEQFKPVRHKLGVLLDLSKGHRNVNRKSFIHKELFSKTKT